MKGSEASDYAREQHWTFASWSWKSGQQSTDRMNRMKAEKAIRYKVWTEKPGTIGRRAPNQTNVSADTAEGWENEFAEISSEVAGDAAKQQRCKREEQGKKFVRVQVGREEGDRWLLYEPVTKWGTSTQSLPPARVRP